MITASQRVQLATLIERVYQKFCYACNKKPCEKSGDTDLDIALKLADVDIDYVSQMSEISGFCLACNLTLTLDKNYKSIMVSTKKAGKIVLYRSPSNEFDFEELSRKRGKDA